MKKIKILIIVLVSILIIGIGTLLALYFTTDIFKSNKKMFNNYLSKMDLGSFIDVNDLYKSGNKMLEEPFCLEGNVSAKLELDEELETDFSINEELNYAIKNDPNKKYTSAKIEFKQDDDKNFAINFLRNEDLYGIQYVDIIKQYIVVKNENLKEFAKKMGATDTTKIPDKIDINQLQKEANIEELPNLEEIIELAKPIGTKYLNLFINQIPERNYTKIKKEQIVVENNTIEANGYKLTLTGEELENIMLKILSTAKDDNEVYNLISKIVNDDEFDFDTYKGIVENSYKNGLGIKDEVNYLNIIVYKQGNNLVRVYGKLEGEMEDIGSYVVRNSTPITNTINLELFIDNDKTVTINYEQDGDEKKQNTISISKKNLDENNKSYEIKLIYKQNDEEKSNANITLSKTGKADDKKIETNTDIQVFISEIGNIKIQNNNNIEIGLDVEIEEFKEGNYGIINDFTQEQINNLSNYLQEQLSGKIDLDKTITGTTISIALNGGLFTKAREARDNTIEAQAKEAVAITKADILADYYTDGIQFPDGKTIANKIEQYLGDDWKVVEDRSIQGLYYFNITDPYGGLIEDIELDLTSIYNQEN